MSARRQISSCLYLVGPNSDHSSEISHDRVNDEAGMHVLTDHMRIQNCHHQPRNTVLCFHKVASQCRFGSITKWIACISMRKAHKSVWQNSFQSLQIPKWSGLEWKGYLPAEEKTLTVLTLASYCEHHASRLTLGSRCVSVMQWKYFCFSTTFKAMWFQYVSVLFLFVHFRFIFITVWAISRVMLLSPYLPANGITRQTETARGLEAQASSLAQEGSTDRVITG